jgi:hypothetical protein
MSDDWGDVEDDVRRRDALPRRPHSHSRRLGRQQRLEITIAVGAALLLIVGIAVGFSLGRATAPKPPSTQALVVATQTVETSAAVETTVEATPTPAPVEATQTATPTPPAKDTTKPKTPNQLAPDNGAVLSASTTTVKLRWSKVSDPSGVKYYFQIENRIGSGWGASQTIGPLTSSSYTARVFTSRRRWRVWAVDGAGNKSVDSGWSTYRRSVPAPSPSKPSSTTTQ